MNKDNEIAFLNDKSFADAVRWATMKHSGQKRDFSNADYITHPIRVASEVYFHGWPTDAVLIALFHDVVEDTNTSLDEIEQHWGANVREGVYYLTEPSKLRGDNHKLSKEERKKEFMLHVANGSGMHQTIKIIDIMDNTIDMCRFVHKDIKRAEKFLVAKREMLDACVDARWRVKHQVAMWLNELERVIEHERKNKYK